MHRLIASAAVTTTLAGAIVGCSGGAKPSPSTSKSVTSVVTSHSSSAAAIPQSDYTGLLIKPGDLIGPETYTATTPINNPNGQPGATTTFSNQDRTRVIVDSIQIFPDAPAAVRALESAKVSTDGYVHGFPEPIAVGTGGVTISGPSPDGTKGVTVLMFTEGRAYVELEFDGPPDALVPPEFVADVGQKQDAAIKSGLAG